MAGAWSRGWPSAAARSWARRTRRSGPTYELRYAGQAFELPVEAGAEPAPDELREGFDAAHEERYGYRDRRRAAGAGDRARGGGAARLGAGSRPPRARPSGGARARARFGDEVLDAAVLGPGTAEVDGPAVFELPGLHAGGAPGLVGHRGRRGGGDARVSLDAIELQVMLGALRAACDEMGVVLVRSAHSANIKERRDASTALFDAGGRMVMQAEHIPVHLGAMPSAVAAVLDEEQAPGDAWILNDPFRGGTHLPDITVVSPVFHEDDAAGVRRQPRPPRRRGRARARQHARRLAHAGRRGRGDRPHPPGPRRRAGPRAAGRPDRRGCATPASARPTCAPSWPPTGPARNGCWRWPARRGPDTVLRAFEQTLDYAERRTRARIAELEDGERTATDVLEAREGDLELRLKATVRGDEMVLDFTGSAAQHEGNLNCPLAVTLSASYFALRVLTDPDVPPCAGAYRPLEVIAPEGCLLNAASPAAVAGGNVETSSRVADLVLAAFGHALGQGTMNNFTLGNERLHLLRDARRRPGRLRRRRRPERRARGHVQHAEHADRGAGAGVPAAGGGVLGAARLGRRRPPPRRRGRGARAGGAGADALLADHRAPPPRAAGRRRRRARASAGATA